MRKTGTETRVTIWSYSRGGSPTAFDRIMASKMGHRPKTYLRRSWKGLRNKMQ